MSSPNPYRVPPSAPPNPQSYPSVTQGPPQYPPAPANPGVPSVTHPQPKSTSDDFKAVAKGVAGVARLMGKGAAALGTAAVKAGVASTSASTAPTAAPAQYGRGAAPNQQSMRPGFVPPVRAQQQGVGFFTAPTPASMGLAFTPKDGTLDSTCWCGFRDDPAMSPCARVVAKTALFPLALAAYPVGAATFAALQLHLCIFSCCMMHHLRAATTSAAARAAGTPHTALAQKDVVDCWQCQAETWVWLDNVNGNCWTCELPVSKRAVRGHVVEAPCQLCLWGSTR
jgi:hypothetical protein